MPLVGEKLSRSIDNFSKSARENHLLVDKTQMLKAFIESPDEVCLITRHRRSGKSFNLSMLQHFFAARVDGNPTAGLFDKFAIAHIDEGRYIKEHQGKYPVIFLSLKSVKGSSYKELIIAMKDVISTLFREHKAVLLSDKLDDSDKALFNKYHDEKTSDKKLETSLHYFSEMLYYASSRQPVIILIDEYDPADFSSSTRLPRQDE